MADERAECPVCHRFFVVSASGHLRAHGPRSNRCPGSHSVVGGASHSQPSVVSQSSSSPRGSARDGSPSPPSSPSPVPFLPLQPGVPIVRRLPKASRRQAASSFRSLLEEVVRDNSLPSWERLLSFAPRCLFSPSRGGKRWSLATQLNKQIASEAGPPVSLLRQFQRRCQRLPPSSSSSVDRLRSVVSQRLEEGDFRGAIRIASSDSSIAVPSSVTLQALRDKHPPSPVDFNPPSDFPTVDHVCVSEVEVSSAICSFPCGSAGGPDGLRPQHLKDMVSSGPSEPHLSPLLSALASFSDLVLKGEVPPSVRPYFFGARLLALDKNGGGIRPIAIGGCLRRLVAKVACRRVSMDMSELLAPHQLGFGVKGGVEAAIHSAHCFLDCLPAGEVMIKVDFSNAFNSAHRDCMLEVIRDLYPDIFSLVHSAHSSPSSLYWLYFQLRVSSKVTRWQWRI